MPMRELENDIFFMSLEEARQALRDDYEYLQERHERRKPAHKRTLA